MSAALLTGKGLFLFGVLISVVLSGVGLAHAQQQEAGSYGEFTKYEGSDNIKSSPEAQKILDKIEESKRILKEMMEKQQPIVTEHQTFIEEQRKIAQGMLAKDLESMNKKYEEFTPRNAFGKFLSGVNSTHHQIYWDQFNYMEEKIRLAKSAKQQVLDNGGTFSEAQREFVKYASMPRVEMISLIKELNVKHGFADAGMQELFDKYGKLPRYENDSENIPCYGCDVYEPLRDALMEQSDEIDSQVSVNKNNDENLKGSVNFVAFEDTNSNTHSKQADSATGDASTGGEDDYDREKLSAAINKLEQKIDDLTEELIREDDEQRQKELMGSIEKTAQILRDLKQL